MILTNRFDLLAARRTMMFDRATRKLVKEQGARSFIRSWRRHCGYLGDEYTLVVSDKRFERSARPRPRHTPAAR